MIVDIMGIVHADDKQLPNYGSLYLIFKGIDNVNEYGGENEMDVSKLDNITNASHGSTCLFSNGNLYRLELSGWKKFGEKSDL